MADQIMDQVRELAEGQIVRIIVYILQTEQWSRWAVSFLVGYFKEDIKLALALGLIGSALTFALVVPPWPFFNRHPVRWLPAAGSHAAAQEIIVDGKTIS
ncbi:microsomal signal peptidase 12kDa subunit protein [Rutstroemia sp. NJR-2017a WRK4]|nr:microsomal signal peptidase 12kDa subunit protein [Rutstroemia sp. NJR-2017a WRK4]